MRYAGFVFQDPIMIADQQSLDEAVKIIQPDKYVEYGAMAGFIENNKNDLSLEPVKVDAIDINDTHQALIWQDPENPGNPDYMFAVIIELGLDDADNLTKKISGIIAGDEFQGVLTYRKTCCDEETGISAFVTTMRDGQHLYNVGDGVGTKQACKQLFSPENAPGRVKFSSSQMKHIYGHAMNQNCDHDHRQDLPSAIPSLAR